MCMAGGYNLLPQERVRADEIRLNGWVYLFQYAASPPLTALTLHNN